jgi:hypothetical protein
MTRTNSQRKVLDTLQSGSNGQDSRRIATDLRRQYSQSIAAARKPTTYFNYTDVRKVPLAL